MSSSDIIEGKVVVLGSQGKKLIRFTNGSNA